MESHYKFLSLAFKLANHLNSVVIKWDPKAQRMLLNHSHTIQKRDKQRCTIFRAFTCVFLVGVVISLAWGIFRVKDTLNLILLFLSLIGSITGYCYHSVLHRNAHDFCVFANGLHAISHKLKQNRTKRDTTALLHEIAAYMLLISAILYAPTFAYAFHFQNPCKPSLMGYWLLPECWIKTCSFSTKPTNAVVQAIYHFQKMILLTANYWLVSFGVNAGPLAVGYLMLLCTVSLKQCLKG